MKLFRISTLLAVGGSILAGAVLFMASQGVQKQEDRLQALERAIRHEQENIRVLNAEWDYLNRPERLELLVKTHMQMDKPALNNMTGDVNAIPEPFMVMPPQSKPHMDAHPVTFTSSESEKKKQPSVKPVREHDGFNDLLHELQKKDVP